MEALLLSENAIAVYEVIVIVILMAILITLKKKNKEMRERRKVTDIKTRNRKLEEMLKNPDSDMDWGKSPNPFEVEYVPKTDGAKENVSAIQMEIEVHTEMSVQHYLFDLNHKITIGYGEKNTLPLNDPTIAEHSCSIALRNRSVYLKNEDQNEPICMQRGKNESFITNQIVKLQSKDILLLGKTALHISLYEN